MARPARRPRRRGIWTRIKRLLGLGAEPSPPPEPPDEEPSLVPVGPAKGPRPAGSVALELPEEPHDVDARARSDDAY